MAATLERKSKPKTPANGKATRLPQVKPRAKKPAPAVEENLLTAEEYWATCNGDQNELIKGKVVEFMPPGGEHGEIAGIIFSCLLSFVRKNKLGRVFVESGFRLTSRDVRSPDVSFVRTENLPDGRAPRAFIEGAPTLAVEVISPGDEWSKVEEKVQLYLAEGTLAVWLVEPQMQTVTVRTATEARVYDSGSTLPGEPALPGFKLLLKEIFSS